MKQFELFAISIYSGIANLEDLTVVVICNFINNPSYMK